MGGGGVNTMEATIKNKDRSRWNDTETKNKATIPWETKHNRGMENDKTRQGNKYNKTRKRKTTHPRDGSLSASNPARALDTLSGYHGKDDEKLNRRKN